MCHLLLIEFISVSFHRLVCVACHNCRYYPAFGEINTFSLKCRMQILKEALQDKTEQGRCLHCPLIQPKNCLRKEWSQLGQVWATKSHVTHENIKIKWDVTCWSGEFQMCKKMIFYSGNNSKTIRFQSSKTWEALFETDQARSVMKQQSKGVWLTPWVRFRCFVIWQRPTPSPVFFFFRFIVVRQPASSHASLLSVRRNRSSQVIIHRSGDILRVCSRAVCVYTLTDLDQTQIRLMSLSGRVCIYRADKNHSLRLW